MRLHKFPSKIIKFAACNAKMAFINTATAINNLIIYKINSIATFKYKYQHCNVLFAFYDLQVSPATFDFALFLVLAELERSAKRCSALHVVIVPGPNEGFRKEHSTPYSTSNKQWRLRNIIVPCCWLIPNVYISVCADRKEAGCIHERLAKFCFPRLYTVKFPVASYLLPNVLKEAKQGKDLLLIQSTPQAQDFAKTWAQTIANNLKIISITLRESKHDPSRNSNLMAWAAFAAKLDRNKYLPVFIRDVDVAFSPIPNDLNGQVIFSEASWNMEIRCAFYELCHVNLFVNNGPVVLAYFNKNINYLIFKMIAQGSGSTTIEHYKKIGFPCGSQLPFATPFQRIIWEDDNLAVIEREFHKINTAIECG